MKCKNCRKDIIDNKNYCQFCGEPLAEENLNIKMDMTSANNKNAEQIKEATELVKKNKLIIAIVAAVLVVLIGGIFTFDFIKSRPLSEGKIKDSIIGQDVLVSGVKIKLSDKNISKVIIKTRATEKKYRDDVVLEVVVDYKKATITFEYNISYYYNKDKREWAPTNAYSSSITKIETKNKFEDAIKKNIEKADTVNNSFDYSTTVYGYQVSKISNYVIEGEKESREFTADIELSNGVYTTMGEIEGSGYYDFSTMEWKVDYVNITDINDSKENKKVDEDILLKVAKGYLRDSYVTYKYKIGEDEKSASFYIESDMISEMKVNNYTSKEGSNQLRLEIEGKAKNGVITNMEFSGVIMIPLKIGEYASSDSEIELSKVEVKAPTLDLVKEEILDKRVNNNKIKLADASTFKETSRYDKFIDCVYINGTIEIGGETKEVQVKVVLEKSYDDDKAVWSVDLIAEKGKYNYKEFE